MGNTLFSSDSERSSQNNFRYQQANYDHFSGLPAIRDRQVVSRMARLSLDQSGYKGRGSVFFKNHFLNNKNYRDSFYFYFCTAQAQFLFLVLKEINSMTKAEIEAIPRKNYRCLRSSRHESCHVCLLEFENGDKVRKSL